MKRGRRETLLTWAPLVLVLVGVAVLVYPVLATQHNNAEQRRIAAQYGVSEGQSGDVVREQLSAAEAYNDVLDSMPILDPWLDGQRTDDTEYKDYLAELDLNPVMSRLTVPGVHIDLPVYHGTEESTLDRGVGHLFGTSLPVGGASTHSVLTAHSGLGAASLFDNLRNVKLGDVFYVETLGRAMKYRVISIDIVLPHETESLVKQPGRDLMTLITCTPYGVNTHRLLVTGERVAADTGLAGHEAVAEAPMAQWMIIVLAIAAVIVASVIGILARLAVLRIRRRRA